MANEAMISEAVARQALGEKARVKIESAAPHPTKEAEIKAQAAAHKAYVDTHPTDSPAENLSTTISLNDRSSAAKAAESVDSNIGTAIDQKTGKKVIKAGTPEATRKAEADTLDAAHREILDKKGAVDIKDAKFKEIRKQLDEIIDIGPLSSLSYLTPDQRADYVYAELLKDPRVLSVIMERSAANFEVNIPDNVSQVRKEAEAAKRAADAKKGERDSKDTELKNAKTTRDSYADETTPGAKGYELKQLKAGKPELEIAKIDIELKQIKRWQDEPKTRPADKTTDQLLERQLELTEQRLEVQKKLDDIERMEKDRAGLPDKITELEGALQKLNAEYTELDNTHKDAAAALSSAVLQRGKTEQDWINQKKTIVRDAVAKIIQENMDQVTQDDRARLEQMKSEAKTAEEAALLKDITTRYFKDATPGKIGKYVRGDRVTINKDNAREDVATALRINGGGRDQLVKEALERMYGKGDPKVAEKMKDIEFVKTAGDEILTQSFNAYLRTGGKFHAQEGVYLESTDWGKGLIEKAIASNKAVKEMDAKLKAAGVKGGIREFMKTKKGLVLGGVIAAILAVAAGAITGPVGAGVAFGAAAGAEGANYAL